METPVKRHAMLASRCMRVYVASTYLHAGSGRVGQMKYFQAALDRIGNPGDLVNKVLEVDPDSAKTEQVVLRIYDFPRGES